MEEPFSNRIVRDARRLATAPTSDKRLGVVLDSLSVKILFTQHSISLRATISGFRPGLNGAGPAARAPFTF